ncbi:tissue inhibitor of metalloproteinase-like [Musca vetustissima]|uniref:tissue inhibitor of metalloproteinase-like n=1 Tax=Musca vetustissima TaxID=27455 RepID=UPI002AB5EFD7|nr:tissue inhibitor of metalloproteinase-like [Musca vetustissima]XP_061401419.1 tissue inhibitor of metalloproteinase-like [Musca vetustissima]
MEITRILTLLGIVIMAIITFYATPADACMCLPSHPQTHYCEADYVALIRVMRKSSKLVAGKIVYKVEVKKSYKMTQEGQRTLKHGRIMTSAHDSMCGVNLQLGRLYVIAGRGDQLNMCHYAKEYKKMSIIERTGFTGAYKKGCGCQITPCFGNRCLDYDQKSNVCQWSPFAKCETDYSACMPARARSPFSVTEPMLKCRWRRTVQYDECKMNP